VDVTTPSPALPSRAVAAGRSHPSLGADLRERLADGSLAARVHDEARALPGRAVTPHAAEAEIDAHDRAWVRRMGLVPSERAASKHAAIRCASFGASTYAHAPTAVATLGTNLISWLYLWDDRFGEGAAGETQAELRERFAAFEAIARTGHLPAQPSAFHLALVDLVTRGTALGGAAWRERFATSLSFYMEGCAQELPFRRTGRVPTFAQYRAIKLRSVGAAPVYDLVELALGRPLAHHEARNGWITEARRMAAFLCAWVNDIYSFPKEARDGDPLNLVAVLMRARGVDVDAALDAAIELYARDLVRFDALLARARAHGVSASTQAILTGLEDWVHGNRAWTGSCGRYQR
jgi:5-epi-alpha-selinene synthase